MSLGRQLKNELITNKELLDCCSSWELKTFISRHGYYSISKAEHVLSIEIDCSALARYLFSLLKRAGVESPVIIYRQEKKLSRNKYIVQVFGLEQLNALLVYLNLKDVGRHISLPRANYSLPKRKCCRRAYARAMFLAGGSLSVSKKSDYHLEINCGTVDDALTYKKVLAFFSLYPLLRLRRGIAHLYFKNAEAIADYLRMVGAGKTLLELESMRVVKSVRAEVNRLVNCDTANVEKTVKSAQKQIRLIRQVDSKIGLDNIKPSLKEIARIRLDHPDASLKEIGELLVPQISKSAVNYRFKKLENIVGMNKQNSCQVDS